MNIFMSSTARRAADAHSRDLAEVTRRGLVHDRVVNLLTLASLDVEGSAEAAEEAAALLLGEESAAERRIRLFCEEIQVAGQDYHARITAGQIVNLLAGRDANDDGALLTSSAPTTRPLSLPRLAG